jgi:hypothetical protein
VITNEHALCQWIQSEKYLCDGLYHRLNPVAGLCHGVLVEVAHHFFDPHHQGGTNVVMSFIDM